MRRFLLGLAVGVVLTLLAPLACPDPPGGLSRDSLALVHLADSIGRLRARLAVADSLARQDSIRAADAAASGAAHLATGDRRRTSAPAPAPLPAEADTAQLVTYLRSRESYLEGQLALATARAESYRRSAVDFRTAYVGAVQSASRWYTSSVVASTELARVQDTLPKLAIRIGELEGQLRRVPKWEAGPLFELGRTVPVGGYLARDLGRLALTVQLTDGPNEAPTGRLAVGVRF